MSDPAGAAVEVEHVRKGFGRVQALRDVSLKVSSREAVAITGRSGSGKSTLLALIGGLERPDGGRVLIDGRPIWTRRHPAHVRRDVVGFVFQRHMLLESLSAQGNVEVPLLGAGMRHSERRKRALSLLDEVGLAARASHLPSQLSGGERQRVAVARALANEPRLLLADEPTGALDSLTSERILDLLFSLRDQLGMTMIVVSYDAALGERADRTVTLIDGEIVEDDEEQRRADAHSERQQQDGERRADAHSDRQQQDGERRADAHSDRQQQDGERRADAHSERQRQDGERPADTRRQAQQRSAEAPAEDLRRPQSREAPRC